MSLPAANFPATLPPFFSSPPAVALSAPAVGDAHALLLALSNIMTEAILIKGSDGRIVFANPTAMYVFGSSKETIIGRTNRDLCFSSRDACRMEASDQAVMASRTAETIEETMEFVDGTRAFESSRMPWLDRHGKILGVICISNDITERLRMERALTTHQAQPKEPVDAETQDARALIGHLQGHWEEEKSAIARQLRNEFGSGLTALNLRLTTLLRQLPDEPEFIAQSERISSLLDSVARAARRIHGALDPTGLAVFGFRSAIANHIADFERRTGIRCRVDIPDDDLAYPPHIGIALYRMAQESLNRIAMHGAASHVELVLNDSDESIVLRIRDNGCGLNGRMLPRSMTIGMRRMRKQIGGLGGVVRMTGTRSRGTELIVALPKPFGDRGGLCAPELEETDR